jgi:multidrug resistance protein
MNLRESRVVAVGLVTLSAFTDLLAYSVAVPVLPDLSRDLGASPATIGFLFASFGVTLLAVSIPMGSISDRVGRKGPLLVGLVALATATLLFAFSTSLPWLFAARLMQGAADGITWVVGFALVADLYGPAERGRVMGIVMSGTSFGLMAGPSVGGWLYEVGGIRLPFLVVAVLAALTAAGVAALRLPTVRTARDSVPLRTVIAIPSVLSCIVAVVAASATTSMLEPVLSLWLAESLGLNPGRVGLVFGIAAVASTVLHPVYGRLADRWGGRVLTFAGLFATAAVLPLVSRASSFESAVAVFLLQAAVISLVVTPSLAFMAEAMSQAGVQSFGVAYGIYNVAWGIGLVSGPAAGGVMYERFGFERLTLYWAIVVTALALALIWPRAGRTRAATV